MTTGSGLVRWELMVSRTFWKCPPIVVFIVTFKSKLYFLVKGLSKIGPRGPYTSAPR
jgi:hypothetical protein